MVVLLFTDRFCISADRSRQHQIAPPGRPDPVKAVLASDLVAALAPPELLAAWRQVMDDQAASEAAFDRLLGIPQ